MSEQDTNEMNNSRTFEERVFLRFDAMDARFNSMDTRFERIETRLNSIDGKVEKLDSRVEKLEAKQYDTKPIWEQALTAISEVGGRLDETNTRLEQFRSEMKAEFVSMREQVDHSLHHVGWQIDALNKNILKVQADQLYLEKRQRDFEANKEQP